MANNRSLDSSRLTVIDLARIHTAHQFEILNYAALIANNHHSEMTLLPGYPHIIHKQDPDLVVGLISCVYHDAVKARRLKSSPGLADGTNRSPHRNGGRTINYLYY